MKVLITGGAGYLGTELVRKLSRHNAVTEIVVYDNLSRGNFNLFMGEDKFDCPVKLIEGDVLDSRKFRQALEKTNTLFHLAAKVTTPFSDQHAHLFEQVNHWGTAEVVYAVEKSSISNFIFLSSTSVYGTPPDEATENTPAKPKTNYGRSKLNAEKHVERLFKTGLRTHIIRCGNIFGFNSSMRYDSVINKFVFEANFKNRICIHGDGEQCRAFIPVNLASNILAELPFSDFSSGTYNLVTNSWTVNLIADTLNEVFPNLERVFVDQDLQLSRLKVQPNSNINRLANCNTNTLNQLLREFVSKFTF